VHIDNLSSWNGAEVADAKGKLNFNGLVQVKHTAMMTTWAKARFFTYFGRRDEADNRFAAGDCGMLTSSSSLFGALQESRKVATGVSSLPYHDDVQGAPQQTLAGGATRCGSGAGQKPAEYKGAASFVSFLLNPELQVEFSAVEGFLPMTAAARAAAGSKLLKADVAASMWPTPVAGSGCPARPARVGDRAGADHRRRGTGSRLVRQDAGQGRRSTPPFNAATPSCRRHSRRIW
jgi:sn-glycerol 3-phosphate transport system substrate-binding protein